MVELMLPQVVPLPTEPAVIATSLVGKLRVVLTAPLTIDETTSIRPPRADRQLYVAFALRHLLRRSLSVTVPCLLQRAIVKSARRLP